MYFRWHEVIAKDQTLMNKFIPVIEPRFLTNSKSKFFKMIMKSQRKYSGLMLQEIDLEYDKSAGFRRFLLGVKNLLKSRFRRRKPQDNSNMLCIESERNVFCYRRLATGFLWLAVSAIQNRPC